MKNFIGAVFLLWTLYSCNTSTFDYAITLTKDVKTKIIEDSNAKPDSSYFDSSLHRIVLLKKGKKLKEFWFKPNTIDTIATIFYSGDENWELVRELCPANERSFEGVRYKGNHIGLAEFKFCNGQIKERGLRFNNMDVGKWTKYDSSGKIIEVQNHDEIDKLEIFKELQYYR